MTAFFNTLLIFYLIYWLVSISGFFSGKAGILNIALNGFMIIGATTFVSVDFLLQQDNPLQGNLFYDLIAGLVAIGAGLLFSLLYGFAILTLRGNQIVVGTAMNLLAAATAIIMILELSPSGSISITPFLITINNFQLGYILTGVVVALFIIFLWWVVQYTKWGRWIKAAGSNPNALANAGINPVKVRYMVLLLTGLLASVGGILFAVNARNFSGNVLGVGYIALGVVFLGQWRIIWTTVASFGFALVYSAIQIYSPTAILSGMKAVTYVLPLLILPFFTFRSNKTPLALGKVYNPSGR